MKCKKCGSEIKDGILYCTNCGAGLISDKYEYKYTKKYFSVLDSFFSVNKKMKIDDESSAPIGKSYDWFTSEEGLSFFKELAETVKNKPNDEKNGNKYLSFSINKGNKDELFWEYVEFNRNKEKYSFELFAYELFVSAGVINRKQKTNKIKDILNNLLKLKDNQDKYDKFEHMVISNYILFMQLAALTNNCDLYQYIVNKDFGIFSLMIFILNRSEITAEASWFTFLVIQYVLNAIWDGDGSVFEEDWIWDTNSYLTMGNRDLRLEMKYEELHPGESKNSLLSFVSNNAKNKNALDKLKESL